MEAIITRVTGKRSAEGTSAASHKAPRRHPLPPRVNGKFVSTGLPRAPKRKGPAKYPVRYAKDPRTGLSEAQRLRDIRGQRRLVLDALKAIRARRAAGERFPRGTIKVLKDESRQLLNRSKLTRGL